MRSRTSRPRACQRAQDHRREDAQVDVAAGEHEADLAAAEPVGVREHRREPRDAGALDDDLLDLERERDRVLERVLGHEEQVVDERARRSRVSARRAT